MATDLGKISQTTDGFYNPSTIYERLDTVRAEGGSYLSRIDNNNQPLSNVNAWQISALDGIDGIDGVNGTNAQSFNFKSSIDSYEQLPSTGNIINDAYYNLEDKLLYVYNGTSFPIEGEGLDVKGSTEMPDWIAQTYTAKSLVIKDYLIYRVVNGQTALSTDIPGTSNKWEIINSSVPNFAVTKSELFNIFNDNGIWKLNLINGALVFGNDLVSKNSVASNLVLKESLPNFIYGDMITGEIINLNEGVYDNNLIHIGICYPGFQLYSFICEFAVNGNPYNISITKQSAVYTKPEWFNFVQEAGSWRLKIPMGSFFYSNGDFEDSNSQIEDILINGNPYNYIYVDVSTRRIFKSNTLINDVNAILIGGCSPSYGMYGLRCAYAVNGNPYNIEIIPIPDNRIINDSYRDKLADVNHIIDNGQSLSVGQTEIVITTAALYPNLVNFDGVTRTSPYDLSLTGDAYPINRHESFVPITERVNDGSVATGQLRETPTSGILENLALEINKVSSVQFPTLPIQLLGSAPGWGATTVAQLSKGSQYYAQLIADVNGGKSIANAQGKIYKVSAITWTQGESDYIAGTTAVSYKASMIQLRNDLNTDIKAITGQTDDIPIVMYQTATSKGGNVDFPNIAISQYDLVTNEDGFYFATAMYNMNYNDNFHLKSESSKLLGAYYGLTISNLLQDKYKFLHPISKLIQGNICKLNFEVPNPPLKFQNANGVNLTNKGFKVMKSGVDILTSVSIGTDGVSVNLICSESPNGGLVQYGNNITNVTNSIVNLGNLSDSQGDEKTFTISGVVKKLDNWSPIFEYQL